MSGTTFGLTGLGVLTGIFAYATTPELTGMEGLYGAAMIGAGTGVSAAVGAFALGWTGLLAGAITGRSEGAALGGYFLGACAGALLGIFNGYGPAKDIVLDGVNPRPEPTETTAPEEEASYIDLSAPPVLTYS